MITIKTPEEIEILREGGRRLARILRLVSDMVAPGVTTAELDKHAEQLIREGGDVPAFLNYQPSGASRPFPASLCVSVNDEIVHGVPNEKPQTLKEGDIVGLDLGLTHKGLIVDAALTVPVGDIDRAARKLVNITKEALAVGIKASRAGSTVGDIGHAIETFIQSSGFGIVRELCGHGVGHKVHEDPQIPNYGTAGTGPKLEPGMVLALEPMLTEGGEDIILGDDGFTYKTADGKRSAHFEHTIVITLDNPEILTKE